MGFLQKTIKKINQRRDDKKYESLGVSHKEMKRLRRDRGPLQTTLFGKPLKLSNFFWYIHGLNELFLDHSYKFDTKTDVPLILDCGANIGLSAIYFKRLYPNSRVIAFEADKDIANILKENLTTFGYTDVEIVPKAVWTEETTLHFQSDGAVGGKVVEDTNTEKTTDIEAVRLKDYLVNSTVNFLKIDVEGAEYEILKDCRDELHKIENIFIEYHSFLKDEQKLDEILLMLKEAGFKYYIKEAWNNQPYPYVNPRISHYDLQLNIFGYRV